MRLCSVHHNGSNIHYLSLPSVQDVLAKVVLAFEEHVIIIYLFSKEQKYEEKLVKG